MTDKFFQSIWDERAKDGKYQCKCGTWIYYPNCWNFSHIKSRGSRPDLKFVKSNIEICCERCHTNHHNGKP